MRHVEVFRKPGRYGGWPANYGIWSWPQKNERPSEIVVGFQGGYLNMSTPGLHPMDRTRPRVTMLARSTDGGESWQVGEPPLPAHTEIAPADGALGDSPGGISFAHPDFALMCSRTGDNRSPVSWFRVSYDRCRTWEGPYRLPNFGRPGIAARTDYQVRDGEECMLFLTAMKSDNHEGRVFCARTYDGGKTWRFVSWIGDEPAGFSIMPASVRLPDGGLLVATRRHENPDDNVIQLYRGDEEGQDWQLSSARLVDCGGNSGNPPAMIRLRDGRICLTYGYRSEPFGIRAVLSEDEGETWCDPIILRDDGGGPDLGYTRNVQRDDGRIVTVYYYNVAPQPERFIAATIWEA